MTWSAATDNYSGTAGYHVNYHWATLSNGSCINQGANSGWQWVGSTTSWVPVWGSNTCFQFQVLAKDNYGNWGSGSAWSPWIESDQVAPTGSISIAGGAAYATSTAVTLSLTYADAGSGPYQMQVQNAGGAWSGWQAVAPTKAWTLDSGDGTKSVNYQVKDKSGQFSSTYSDTIVLDTINPTATIAINDGALTTASATVTLNVTASDATSGVATTAASNDNVTFTPVSGSAPTWVLTSGDGPKTVWYRVTDVAGRSTTVSDTITLNTDTTAPDPPSVPDLDAASDSGTSSTDDITSVTTPTFSGAAEAGSTVRLYADSILVGSTTADASGAWTVTTSALADGGHSISATATDASDNTSAPSGSLSVTIDTVAPAAPSTPDLDPASDTGGSNTDDRTTIDAPMLTGTAEGETLVTLLEGSTSLGSASAVGGMWSITSSSLADEAHSLTAIAVDAAGNTGPASAALVVTVVPAEVSLLWPASDGLMFETESLSAETVGDPVTSVEFLVDGVVVGQSTTEPFGITWDTTAVADSGYVFEARANLVAGGTVTSTAVSAIVDNTLSSVERLEADLATNRVTVDDYALNGVYAAMAPTAMVPRYQSTVQAPAPIDPTAYLADWETLSASTQNEIAAFVGQPLRGEQWAPTRNIGMSSPEFDGCTTTQLRYYSVTTCEKTSDHFRITYVMGTDNTATTVAMVDSDPADRYPDRVNQVETALESAYSIYMDPAGMGFLSPLEGSEKIDVNLTQSGGSDGLTGPSLFGKPATIMIDPSSGRIPLYIAPHELFHVVQNGYKSMADLLWSERRFWYEASAEWATHQYLQRTSQSDTNYSNRLHAYLGEPEVALEVSDNTERQYGRFIFGEYLDEHYSEYAVRRTWELIGTGNAADEAFANLATENSETLDTLLSDYAEFIYRFEFLDPEESEWRTKLQTDSTAENFTAGDDLSPLARPARERRDLAVGGSATGQATVDHGGMAFVDLAPVAGAHGTFEVRVTRSHDSVRGRLVSWGSYPADCGVQELSFVNNEAIADVVVPPGCDFATLILVHADPMSFWNSTAVIDWEVNFNPISTMIDNFDRFGEPGDRLGFSTLGPAWLSGPATAFAPRAVSPDAFELDGQVGVIWGHPYDEPGSYADPWTSLAIDQELPVDIEARFRINPYAWPGADGSFEINFVVGDAADWAGMTRRVGLDIYDNGPGSAWAGLIGGWTEPYPQVPFSPNTWYRYRLRIEPGQVSHKIWLDSEAEPSEWTAVDLAPQGQELSFTPTHLWIMNANYGVRLEFDWIGLR